MSTYYHVSKVRLPAGTTLASHFFPASNDEGMLRAIADAEAIGPEALRTLLATEKFIAVKASEPPEAPSVYIELIYETVRKSEFPERPSRWDCIYLFDDVGPADRFLKEILQGNGVILVCTIESGEPFTADMNLLQAPDVQKRDVGKAKMVEAARAYWSGTMSDSPWPETLASGRVVVS